MTFLSVLLVLLIERVFDDYRPQRQHRWFATYCGTMAGISWVQWLMARPWGAVLAILPPLLLVAWLQTVFAALGSLPELAFGMLVLLYAIGPRDLGDDTESFLKSRDSGDEHAARQSAEALCPGTPPESEPRRSFAVARAVVVQACTRLIGPIFWFVLFGPVGAAGYRAVHLVAAHLQSEDCPQAMKRYSDEIRHVVDWAPARLTAIGYAIAGNFEAVAHAWRTFSYFPDDGPLTETQQLLADTGIAALDTFPHGSDDPYGEDAMPLTPVVEDALALVWRTLTLWIAVIGGGTLVAWLS